MGFVALKELQAAGDLPDGPPWRQDSHLVVLFWLAKHQGDREGWAWPSIATLARLGQKSTRQVIRIIQELEADRLIEVSRHGYRNRYRLTLPTKATLARRRQLQAFAQPPLDSDTHVTKHSDTGDTFSNGDTGVTVSRDMVTPSAEMVTSTANMVTPVTKDSDIAMSHELKESTEQYREQRGAAAPPSSKKASETGSGAAPSAEQRAHLETIRRGLGLVKVG